MSTVKSMSVTSTEYDAAEALLELSNFRQSENNDRNVETEPNLFLRCIIASNEAEQPVSSFEVAQTVKTDRTCEIGTQTEQNYHELPMLFTISRLRKQIQALEEQIKSNSHEMTMDDNNETFTQPETPEKVKPKLKAGQFNGYNNTANKKVVANADDLVPIGDGNAVIPSAIFRHLNWNSHTSATRTLLTAVFTRRVLATHSLTGKPSPAFPNKPAKKKLDSVLVNDIVKTVVENCSVPENLVRTSITTKCADEAKMFRTRENNKKKRKKSGNRENIPPESDSDEF